jgi:hypothetical protein
MKKTIKSIILTFLLFSNNSIFAQAPSDPGQDPGATPISDYIIPMLLLGIALSFFLIKKKKTV